MTADLCPCSSCSRHVKRGECTCPFCGAKVCCAGARRAPGGRLSRSALFSVGAVGVALGTTDCTSDMPRPAYGGFFPIGEDGSSFSDVGTGPGSDAAPTPEVDGAADAAALADGMGSAVDAGDGAQTTPDAADASDARVMVMPLYGGFMAFDAGRGPGDGGAGG